LPEFEGWIIGDVPCTRDVLLAGKNANQERRKNGGLVLLMSILLRAQN